MNSQATSLWQKPDGNQFIVPDSVVYATRNDPASESHGSKRIERVRPSWDGRLAEFNLYKQAKSRSPARSEVAYNAAKMRYRDKINNLRWINRMQEHHINREDPFTVFRHPITGEFTHLSSLPVNERQRLRRHIKLLLGANAFWTPVPRSRKRSTKRSRSRAKRKRSRSRSKKRKRSRSRSKRKRSTKRSRSRSKKRKRSRSRSKRKRKQKKKRTRKSTVILL